MQAHSGASATDMIMGSIASAEGGFASVEGTDAGVLTWGQGQWIVTNGELQKVLTFIKERRRDLFDKYWGAADLDVQGSDFVHDGKRWTKSKKDMLALFRPNAETIMAWANRFGQAGMDPQIQRLQREYLRAEVSEVLDKKFQGHTPESVLDTRGQAFFYSMDKNLPSGAKANFELALKDAGIEKDKEVTPEQKRTASEAIGEHFKNSSVWAMDIAKHHYIAFWGEGGRKKAVKQADDAIAAGGDATWNVDRWKKHRDNMEARVSRYEKTKADIDKALARQDVEPDVPAGTFGADAHAAPAAAPAAGPGLMETVSEGIGHLVQDAAVILELAATGTGIKPLQIAGSVGRGGKNAKSDVAAVCARMLGVGFAPGSSLTELGDTIARYQTEVVGMRRPDGRIDPGGRTLGALHAGTKAPAGAATQHDGGGSAPPVPAAPPAPAAPASANGSAAHTPPADPRPAGRGGARAGCRPPRRRFPAARGLHSPTGRSRRSWRRPTRLRSRPPRPSWPRSRPRSRPSSATTTTRRPARAATTSSRASRRCGPRSPRSTRPCSRTSTARSTRSRPTTTRATTSSSSSTSTTKRPASSSSTSTTRATSRRCR